MNQQPTIIACGRACVVKDNKLLLVNNNGDYWYLPGGHMEANETLPSCTTREVFEETGYEIHLGDMIYCYEFNDQKLNHHKIECCFYATVNKAPEGVWNDLGHDKSVTMCQFFSLEEIQKLDNVYPTYLKEGKWLNKHTGNTIYMGYDESK